MFFQLELDFNKYVEELQEKNLLDKTIVSYGSIFSGRWHNIALKIVQHCKTCAGKKELQIIADDIISQGNEICIFIFDIKIKT